MLFFEILVFTYFTYNILEIATIITQERALLWFLQNRMIFLPQDISVTPYTLVEKCNIGNVIMQSFWGFVSHFRLQLHHISYLKFSEGSEGFSCSIPLGCILSQSPRDASLHLLTQTRHRVSPTLLSLQNAKTVCFK